MALIRCATTVYARRGAYSIVTLVLLLASQHSASSQAWAGYGKDAQHSALGSVASALPQQIRWSTPVDLAPQKTGSGDLLTHYGSPMITQQNTVLVPVKTAAGGSFRIEAHRGMDGSLLWSLNSDYVLPNHNWIPPFGPTLTPGDKSVVMPGAGGTVIVRSFPDKAASHSSHVAFYGTANYYADPTTCGSVIQIDTPITCDSQGNLYFGYVSTGAPIPGYPQGIPSGLARLSVTGVGSFVSVLALTGDSNMKKVVYNCAPALSLDGSSVYVAVDNIDPSEIGNFASGYLCRVDSATLNPIKHVLLSDPHNGGFATISDDATASPTVGPDGDVYYGVLESGIYSNNARGWMLHFDSTLNTLKTPGAFGWDDSPSIVPANAVPSYSGTSSYLILTKYNNYAGAGTGNGLNKVAVLDPNATETDPVTGTTVMNEVLTVLGPTPDPDNDTNYPGAVREWCINSAAIDPVNKCAVVNSEDGHVYRWDFTTNTLSASLKLTDPTGEAYTSTVIGPDGSVYAINNATLFCCGALPPGTAGPISQMPGGGGTPLGMPIFEPGRVKRNK
jgi:hypothetical protein